MAQQNTVRRDVLQHPTREKQVQIEILLRMKVPPRQ